MTSITSLSPVRARSVTGRLSAFFSMSGISLSGRSGCARFGAGRFLVTFDELAREPAEHVIGDARRMANVRIFCEPARFEPLIREFFHQTLERHAVLKRNRSERADGVHQTADSAAFLRHRDEKLARLAILVQADGDIAFVSGDLELVCQRRARVRHAMAHGLIELSSQHGQFFFKLENALLKRLHHQRPASTLPATVAPMSFVLRVFKGAERFEPSR